MPDETLPNENQALYLLNHAFWAYRGALNLAQKTNDSRHWATAKICLQIYRERLLIVRSFNSVGLAQLRHRRSTIRAQTEAFKEAAD